MAYALSEFPYKYNALEPYIKEKTVRELYEIRHKAYVDGLNDIDTNIVEARSKDDSFSIKRLSRERVFYSTGHYLYKLFWENTVPNGRGPATDSIAARIIEDFNTLEAFKKQFSASALAVKGSGFTTLVWNPLFVKLDIIQVEKCHSITNWGVSQWGVIPLLVVDVWPQAGYCLIGAYIDAWWNLVDWDVVNARYQKVIM